MYNPKAHTDMASYPELLVQSGKNLIRIPWNVICWLESNRNYVNIYTTQSSRPYIIRGVLRELEKILPSWLFWRVHRSHIVGLQYVQQIGYGMVNLGSANVPIGNTYLSTIEYHFVLLNSCLQPALKTKRRLIS